MAAVAELSLLLFALINSIHAEELITVRKKWDSYIFELPNEPGVCLISRFVGEEKLILWNTSGLWSETSTVPEDLKARLSVVRRANISSYVIKNLTRSDSGQYQSKCWTEGKVTYESNISIIICGTIDEVKHIDVRLRETVDLPCEGAADGLDIQWLKRELRYKDEIWTQVFEDGATSVMDSMKGGTQVVKTKSALHLYNLTSTVINLHTCLVMEKEQCVSSHPVQLEIQAEIIYHSVEESAVLQCNVNDFSDDQPPFWTTFNREFFLNSSQEQQNLTMSSGYQEPDYNNSLVFPSLTLNHSGLYFCNKHITLMAYWLMVCPKVSSPAVQLFSEGDEVTVMCRDTGEGNELHWFIKSDQTDSRRLHVDSIPSDLRGRLSIYNPDRNLIISNVSPKDRGEYWCALIHSDLQCVSTTKTLLKYREPFDINFTLYVVRSTLLSVLLVILCVVVVTVIQKTRRREQRSAQTDS